MRQSLIDWVHNWNKEVRHFSITAYWFSYSSDNLFIIIKSKLVTAVLSLIECIMYHGPVHLQRCSPYNSFAYGWYQTSGWSLFLLLLSSVLQNILVCPCLLEYSACLASFNFYTTGNLYIKLFRVYSEFFATTFWSHHQFFY